MIDVIRFILNCVIEMLQMLFRIQVGGSMSLGLLMCIIFIFLPMLLRIVYFMRGDVVEELNQRYDEGRPRESHHAEYYESAPYKNGTLSYSHSFTKSRRRKQR